MQLLVKIRQELQLPLLDIGFLLPEATVHLIQRGFMLLSMDPDSRLEEQAHGSLEVLEQAHGEQHGGTKEPCDQEPEGDDANVVIHLTL